MRTKVDPSKEGQGGWGPTSIAGEMKSGLFRKKRTTPIRKAKGKRGASERLIEVDGGGGARPPTHFPKKGVGVVFAAKKHRLLL